MNKNIYSLAILKPDFKRLDLFNLLEEILKKKELVIISRAEIFMDLDFVKLLYQWEKIDYSNEIRMYLCSESMPIWVVRGNNAIIKMLEIKSFFRMRYSEDQLRTLIHCPDTTLDFEREYQLINNKIGGLMKVKTNNQVEVILFKKTKDGIKYLMLKRNAKKGSFWQPITGNVEIGETFEQAAVRELCEETGIKEYIRLFDTGYSFEFFDDNRQQLEKVYAIEVLSNIEVMLSEEHTDMQWASEEECLNKYLKYPGNKAGLKTLAQMMEAENG
ncbi:MAG TPA: NUDIX pyrophosphatase [Candidatus Moranbacteria bacterium]|nr:NUDIX pyrophosphatase [Candidatus Moranbacteria bacterium]